MAEKTVFDRFRELFSGLDRAFGTYVFDDNVIATDGEKRKGHGITSRDLLEPEYYDEHLNAERMLGVIPIGDDNKVTFSAIDIDDYNLDIPKVLEKVRENRLPLVATRSKSGGLHLWIFYSHRVPSKASKDKLEEIADSLGFPGVEVFPKQIKLGPDDVGNWINLPWFNYTDTDRYGWDDQGNEIRDLKKWLDYAESKKITLRELNRIHVRQIDPEAPGAAAFTDGPPCLQAIAERGVPEGQRNNTLFAMGVYAKHKLGNNDAPRGDVLSELHKINAAHFDPPLIDREVEQIMNNLERGEYRYTCLQPPLKDFCNRQLCLRRKYGVQLNGETFSFGTLWHILPVDANGEPRYEDDDWRLQINVNDREIVLDLSIQELMNYRAIKLKAMQHEVVLPHFDNNDWSNIVTEKINTCQQVHTSLLGSAVGELQTLISEFLARHSSGVSDVREVQHDRAWHNPDEGTYWFKGQAFMNFLAGNRFTAYKRSRLISVLKNYFQFQTDRQKRISQREKFRHWSCPDTLLKHDTDGDEAPDPETAPTVRPTF